MDLKSNLILALLASNYNMKEYKKCVEGKYVALPDGRIIAMQCQDRDCLKHWERYAKKVLDQINLAYPPGYYDYIATLPRPEGLSDNKFEYLRTKWLTKFNLPKHSIKFFWVRHNDFGQINYHFLIRSPNPLPIGEGLMNLLQCYKDADCGIKTAHQLVFEPLKSWDDYTKYLVGLTDKEGKHYPRWYGLKGKCYGHSDNWAYWEDD